jgi:hypothetical protein
LLETVVSEEKLPYQVVGEKLHVLESGGEGQYERQEKVA